MAILSQNLRAGVVYLYDLGHAHGRYTYPSYEEFVTAVAILATGVNSVCYTNNGQTVEREWLNKIGYSSVEIGPRMCFHTLSAEKSAKIFGEIEEANKKAKEKNLGAYNAKYEAWLEQALKEGRSHPFYDIRVGDHVYPRTHILKDMNLHPDWTDRPIREVIRVEGQRFWLRQNSWDYDYGYDITKYSRFLPK
jgi:hypothetical protein